MTAHGIVGRERVKLGGMAFGLLAVLTTPWLFACGGAEEAPRPTATAAHHDGSGTYWGGGGGSANTPPSIGGGRIGGGGGGGGGGGPIGDALRRSRRERERDMRERLGPVRLTGENEAWPLYEGAVRRMEAEIADEDDPCEATMDAGEIFNEEVAGDRRRVSPSARSARCRAYDESMARCVDEDYVAAHQEECRPVLRRVEIYRRESRAERPDAEALEAASTPERRTARGAGLVERPEEEPEPEVLPEMELPGAGNGR